MIQYKEALMKYFEPELNQASRGQFSFSGNMGYRGTR